MQKEVTELLKDALINSIKAHDEYSGTIMEFADNLGEAIKIFYKLSKNVQDEVGQILVGILIENGVLPLRLK